MLLCQKSVPYSDPLQFLVLQPHLQQDCFDEIFTISLLLIIVYLQIFLDIPVSTLFFADFNLPGNTLSKQSIICTL